MERITDDKKHNLYLIFLDCDEGSMVTMSSCSYWNKQCLAFHLGGWKLIHVVPALLEYSGEIISDIYKLWKCYYHTYHGRILYSSKRITKVNTRDGRNIYSLNDIVRDTLSRYTFRV